MVEGAFAELVGACASGGVITAWALYLDLSPALIGLLGALPFAAQLVQLPASWITRRLGSRRAALWTIGVARQCVLPLSLLPWVRCTAATRQAVFLGCTFAASALGVAGNNAWTSWMGDLVPGAVRGAYFGRRAAVCALAATVAALGAGALLDSGGNYGHAGAALCALTLIASAAGAVTTLLLRRQHQPRSATPPRAVPLREALAPMRDESGRRLLAFQLAWSAASGVAAAFYPLHMIGNLRMGFARMALYAAAIAAFKMVAAPLWGRTLDRHGARPILAICSFLLCLSPPLWLFASEGSLGVLALDAAINGVAAAGLSLATFSLPIALSRPATRSFYVAAVAAAGGLAAGLGSAAGGFSVRFLPGAWSLLGRPLVAAHALFLLGAGARFAAAFLALRIIERPAAEVLELPLPAAPGRAKLSA
jgi:MFS family permease